MIFSQRVERWLRRHATDVLVALVTAGVLLRAVLVSYAPRPFGYVWDFYVDGVRIFYTTGRLPAIEACWACGHPPLFFLLGWPFYAFGRWLAPEGPDDIALRWLGGLAMLSGVVIVYYTWRLLRLFSCRGGALVAGVGLTLVIPCLFISSYGPEADVLLAAVLSAFIFYLARDFDRLGRAEGAWPAARIGLLAGAAIATKYSGWVAPVAVAVLLGVQLVRGRVLAVVVRHAVFAAAITLAVGGWKYLDNIQKYGRLFQANGSSLEGLSVGNRPPINADYRFLSLPVGELREVIGPRPVPGELTTFPVYYNVPMSLHAQAWSDMSFFSVPSRHGDPSHPYPRKFVPPSLTMAMILLGFVPGGLVAVGFVRGLRHRRLWPMAVFAAVGLASYVWWFLPQEAWALKTKYILFLLPVYVLYAVMGLAWLWRRAPLAGLLAGGLLATLIATAHVYLYAFARGRL